MRDLTRVRWWNVPFAIAMLGLAFTRGHVFRDQLPSLDGMPAWAGGRPDVAACERAITGTLPRPESYRRQAVYSSDSPVLSQAEFDRQTGLGQPDATRPTRNGDALGATLASRQRIEAMQAQLDRDRAAGHALRLRRIGIDYSATGAPPRAFGICHFRLIDGALEPAGRLVAKADAVARRSALDEALGTIGRHDLIPRRRTLPCCL